MHLKATINLPALLETVKTCQGDVFFHTTDGDNLNLKSILSQYIFVIIAAKKDFALSGELICKVASDYQLIKEYLLPNE